MSSRRQTTLTGDMASSCPRPFGRSGCVTTASADPAATQGYGAWDPPSTVPGHVVTKYTVTYDKPGPHTVSYSTFDVGQCGDKGCPTADKDLTFTVDPPPTTTTAKR